MKKFFCVFLSLIFCFSLFVGCSKEKPEGKKIVCTAFPQYDFIKNIVGSDSDVLLLADNGADLHSYEMTPEDIVAISNADILITVGGESDKWAYDAVSSLAKEELEVVDICSFCTLIEEKEEHDHDHDHGDEHGEEFDEHVWMSPVNAVKITEGLCEVLSRKYPENAEKYKENSQNYIEKLKELDGKFRTLNKGEMIVADRFPFAYFVEEYGFSYVAAFEGCSAEAEASFEKMAELVTAARDKNIKYIFKTDNSTFGLAEKVAETVSGEVLTLRSMQSATEEEIKNGFSYLSASEENFENLKKAFGIAG